MNFQYLSMSSPFPTKFRVGAPCCGERPWGAESSPLERSPNTSSLSLSRLPQYNPMQKFPSATENRWKWRDPLSFFPPKGGEATAETRPGLCMRTRYFPPEKNKMFIRPQPLARRSPLHPGKVRVSSRLPQSFPGPPGVEETIPWPERQKGGRGASSGRPPPLLQSLEGLCPHKGGRGVGGSPSGPL